MVTGLLKITLHIPQSRSLKDKRSVVKSLLGRAQEKFHCAAAEVGSQDKWQLADLGFAVVSTDETSASQLIDAILRFIESGPWQAEVTTYETDTVYLP